MLLIFLTELQKVWKDINCHTGSLHMVCILWSVLSSPALVGWGLYTIVYETFMHSVWMVDMCAALHPPCLGGLGIVYDEGSIHREPAGGAPEAATPDWDPAAIDADAFPPHLNHSFPCWRRYWCWLWTWSSSYNRSWSKHLIFDEHQLFLLLSMCQHQ